MNLSPEATAAAAKMVRAFRAAGFPPEQILRLLGEAEVSLIEVFREVSRQEVAS